MQTTRLVKTVLILEVCLACLFAVTFLNGNVLNVSAGKVPVAGSQKIYLPLIQSQTFTQPSSSARRINAPYFDGAIWYGGAGIFWFGKVTPTENYADVRVAYNTTDLYVRVTVFDRRIWCNASPQANDPTVWDAVTLYFNTNGNSGNTPSTSAYRLVSQFSAGVNCTNGVWSSAYRGNGTSWIANNFSFSADSWYRGDAGPNQDADNKGWVITFRIPFASLGMSGPPSQGNTWGLGLTLHDRDDSVGTTIASKPWPETLVADRPNSWGQLAFGLPSAYLAPPATPRSTISIRHGLNGAVVTDGEVGGGTTCGAGLDHWSQWGEKNYVGQPQINIQNQEDVSDWPCFSKYYVTFPLTTVPAGKVVISSTLTMHLFGNSGQGWNPGPFRSLIQVLTLNEDWNESTLTWNNAPLAAEYVDETYVDPLDTVPPWPGIAYTWNVSSAVAKVYAAGRSLRLVLYSADNPMHSGKYFYSSDADPEGRPMLQVLWGDP